MSKVFRVNSVCDENHCKPDSSLSQTRQSRTIFQGVGGYRNDDELMLNVLRCHLTYQGQWLQKISRYLFVVASASKLHKRNKIGTHRSVLCVKIDSLYSCRKRQTWNCCFIEENMVSDCTVLTTSWHILCIPILLRIKSPSNRVHIQCLTRQSTHLFADGMPTVWLSEVPIFLRMKSRSNRVYIHCLTQGGTHFSADEITI